MHSWVDFYTFFFLTFYLLFSYVQVTTTQLIYIKKKFLAPPKFPDFFNE